MLDVVAAARGVVTAASLWISLRLSARAALSLAPHVPWSYFSNFCRRPVSPRVAATPWYCGWTSQPEVSSAVLPWTALPGSTISRSP